MEKLVKKAKNGEIRALEELVHMNEIKLYKTAKAYLDCEDDVEEAIQRTIILVYENINKLKNNKYFTTWLIRILINECKKILKIHKNDNNRKVSIEVLEEVAETEKDDYSFVGEALKKLDKDFKEVTILYYYDEFSVQEISKILELPQGTVKSRLARAREKLRKMIEEEGK